MENLQLSAGISVGMPFSVAIVIFLFDFVDIIIIACVIQYAAGSFDYHVMRYFVLFHKEGQIFVRHVEQLLPVRYVFKIRYPAHFFTSDHKPQMLNHGSRYIIIQLSNSGKEARKLVK